MCSCNSFRLIFNFSTFSAAVSWQLKFIGTIQYNYDQRIIEGYKKFSHFVLFVSPFHLLSVVGMSRMGPPTPLKMSQEKPMTSEGIENPSCDCTTVTIRDKNTQHWTSREKFRWTLTLFFGSMIVYAVRVSMSISAPAIGKELGWNKQISGMALSAFFCGYVLTNVLGGSLSDRIGGQIVICYTSFGWGVLTFMLPYLARTESLLHTGTTSVLFVRFLTGVCQGVFYPSITAILTKHVPTAERSSILGIVMSGTSAGTMFTGFLGSIIIENYDWSNLFVAIGVVVISWTCWLNVLTSSTITTSNNTPKCDPKPQESVPWMKLCTKPAFWALLISYFLNNYCFYNLLSWAPLYFHDAFPESKGWVFNVVPWIVSFVFNVASGYVADIMIDKGTSTTFVRKFFSAAMFLGTIVFSLLLNHVTTFHQALFVMSINVAVQSFASSCSIINSSDLAPKHAGALHGFMNCSGAMAGFIGVYLTGYILQTTGKWSSIFDLTAGSALVGFLAFQLFGTGERIV